LNINSNINNENQYCKIGMVPWGVQMGEGRVNEDDYDGGIWLIDFTHLYETEQRNLFSTVLSGVGTWLVTQMMGAI
jgi:hypothetical protein